MNKVGKVLAIIIVLGLLSAFTVYIFGPLLMTYTFIKIHSHYVEKMSAVTGLDTYLLNILIALMVIPFIIGLKKLFAFKSRHENRVIGGILLISVLIIYNGSLYYFTRDMYVSPRGEVMKYYDINGNKVEYSDKPGINPRTARRWKEVTAEITPNLKLWEKGIEDFHSVDPGTARWFNPFTGEAELWYCQHADGSFEFYNKPGFHPQTSDPLKPVIKHIYIEWKKGEDERIEKMKASLPDSQNTLTPSESPAATEPEAPAVESPSSSQTLPSNEIQSPYVSSSQADTSLSSSPRIVLSQNSLDFGEINVIPNSPDSRQASITITNAGDGDLIINRILEPSYPFVITGNDCSSRLSAKGECRLFVRFSPSTRTGNQNEINVNRYKASIVIQSNAGSERIFLSGSAVVENIQQRYYSMRSYPDRPRFDTPNRVYFRYYVTSRVYSRYNVPRRLHRR